jgi:hypothetical protein
MCRAYLEGLYGPEFPNPDWVDTYGSSTIDHEGTCIDRVEVS